jgi:hypothetical protein
LRLVREHLFLLLDCGVFRLLDQFGVTDDVEPGTYFLSGAAGRLTRSVPMWPVPRKPNSA